jgi:hypothetical protein
MVAAEHAMKWYIWFSEVETSAMVSAQSMSCTVQYCENVRSIHMWHPDIAAPAIRQICLSKAQLLKHAAAGVQTAASKATIIMPSVCNWMRMFLEYGCT